jgi:hypothetical protein
LRVKQTRSPSPPDHHLVAIVRATLMAGSVDEAGYAAFVQLAAGFLLKGHHLRPRIR